VRCRRQPGHWQRQEQEKDSGSEDCAGAPAHF
jgi:hypothetical protein